MKWTGWLLAVLLPACAGCLDFSGTVYEARTPALQGGVVAEGTMERLVSAGSVKPLGCVKIELLYPYWHHGEPVPVQATTFSNEDGTFLLYHDISSEDTDRTFQFLVRISKPGYKTIVREFYYPQDDEKKVDVVLERE